VKSPSYAVAQHPAGAFSCDQLGVTKTGWGLVAVVADGAGSTRAAAYAAGFVLGEARELARRAPTPPAKERWVELLTRVDAALAREGRGQTTAVIVAAEAARAGGVSFSITGASVGDSEAWLFSEAGEVDALTGGQSRKPLIGSGEAKPVAFERATAGGVVLIGSDGLFKYVPYPAILAKARAGSCVDAVDALAQAAKLPSGGFQDDLSVVRIDLPR
jgi:PPM family protein phosphatase